MGTNNRTATLGVVIPTKNRLDDLLRAVESVLVQNVKPDELVIIDQSASDAAREKVTGLLKGCPGIKLIYTLDNTLTGLTAAKNLSVRISKSDILLFIDDDIVLDNSFLDVILRVYGKFPYLSGVGGMARLPAGRGGALRRLLAPVFQLGPFRDSRSLLQAGFMRDREIVDTWLLSGGLSSLRRNVFDHERFEESLTGASPIEDMDFYSRASKRFEFALAPAARALHNVSSASRAGLKRSFLLKTSGFSYIFSKYVPKTPGNTCAFIWRNCGLLLDAVTASIAYRSTDPLAGFFLAWLERLRRKGDTHV